MNVHSNFNVPYTCNDCPGRLQATTEAMRWRLTANSLAKQLGKIEYAQATYDDLWDFEHGQ